MAFRFQSTTHTAKLIIIAEFLLVSYLLYTLTESVYESYQMDVLEQAFESENARIEEENRIKSEDFEYYSSNAYIEKIAKQNLGLVNAGEEVIIMPNEIFAGVGTGEEGAVFGEDDARSELSNPERWWKFFFDR